VGISHFNGSFWFGDLEHPRVLRSMELFAREVMPAFRSPALTAPRRLAQDGVGSSADDPES
jgi:hypothetical protein